MADKFFINLTPGDIVLCRKDNTMVTIPKSGKMLTLDSHHRPEEMDVIDGIPILEMSEKNELIGASWRDMPCGSSIIVIPTTALLLTQNVPSVPGRVDVVANSGIHIYSPSMRPEDQVRDKNGGLIAFRALQKYN